MIAVPSYVVYKALNDVTVMDRLLSSYKEIPNPSGCSLRQVKTRGGSARWSISTGFAFHGADRWAVSVILDQLPTADQLISNCETLKRIADHALHSESP